TAQPRPELRYAVLSNDEAALARALHASQAGVDVALGLSPVTLPLLHGLRGGWQVRTSPSLAVEHLELNQATPALRDLRVREALQAALDKRALVRALFPSGPQPVVATSLLPSSSPFHDQRLRVSPPNLVQARQLL